MRKVTVMTRPPASSSIKEPCDAGTVPSREPAAATASTIASKDTAAPPTSEAEADAVLCEDARYTGTLKFYRPKAGYGIIVVDPEYCRNPSQQEGGGGGPLDSELRVLRSSIHAGGEQPHYMENLAVEFNVRRIPDSGGKVQVHNVTLPGEVPLMQAVLENRQAVDSQAYRGEVKLWNARQGWGFIKVDPSMRLPPHAEARLAQQARAAAQRAAAWGRRTSDEELVYCRLSDVKPGTILERGSLVMFHIYVDDKGVGATEVQAI
mmetsp:Transcript_96320/g.272357  ORF Transcript_96320/g.272357 Transcript_96320/m.272357 type:complete len:264 (+) Transcript_96320:63-854(+)